jgi:hypothetical protein
LILELLLVLVVILGVGLGVGDATGVGVDEAVGVGIGVGVGVGWGETAGASFSTTMPLLQRSDLPLLVQVNLLPLYTFVIPAFAQVAPDLGGVAAKRGFSEAIKIKETSTPSRLMAMNDN